MRRLLGFLALVALGATGWWLWRRGVAPVEVAGPPAVATRDVQASIHAWASPDRPAEPDQAKAKDEPAEKKTAEKKIAEKKSATKKSATKKAAEKKVSDQRSPKKKAAGKKPAGKKPAEKKAAPKKSKKESGAEP